MSEKNEGGREGGRRGHLKGMRTLSTAENVEQRTMRVPEECPIS